MPELALNDLSYQDKLRSVAEYWAKVVGGEFVENENWIKVVEASEDKNDYEESTPTKSTLA